MVCPTDFGALPLEKAYVLKGKEEGVEEAPYAVNLQKVSGECSSVDDISGCEKKA